METVTYPCSRRVYFVCHSAARESLHRLSHPVCNRYEAIFFRDRDVTFRYMVIFEGSQSEEVGPSTRRAVVRVIPLTNWALVEVQL